MNLWDNSNELIDFLSYYGKRRDRRKYVEFFVGKFSIIQEYSDDYIYIRKKRDIKKYRGFNLGGRQNTRTYEIIYSCINTSGLKYVKYYLNKDNYFRKIKIEKLCGLKI